MGDVLGIADAPSAIGPIEVRAVTDVGCFSLKQGVDHCHFAKLRCFEDSHKTSFLMRGVRFAANADIIFPSFFVPKSTIFTCFCLQ